MNKTLYFKKLTNLIEDTKNKRDKAFNRGEKILYEYYCNQLKGIYQVNVIAKKHLIGDY